MDKLLFALQARKDWAISSTQCKIDSQTHSQQECLILTFFFKMVFIPSPSVSITDWIFWFPLKCLDLETEKVHNEMEYSLREEILILLASVLLRPGQSVLRLTSGFGQ